MSRDCCVALPHDATGLSAVCDCGIPDHTHLLFLQIQTDIIEPFNSTSRYFDDLVSIDNPYFEVK